MSKRTKRQHILPRSYLRRFSEDDQVYVHNFSLSKTYINNITDAACIDDVYTVQTKEKALDDCVEGGLLADVEGRTDPIIEKMVETRSIPEGEDKALLCNYCALMYTRGVWFRQIYHEVYEHLLITLFDRMMSDEELYTETMEKVKSKSDILEDIPFDKAREMKDKFDVGVDIPRTYYVMQMMVFAAPLINLFYDMNFNLIYIPAYSYDKYITSDRPFIEMTNSGEIRRWIEDPEAELYFPLISTLCLMMDMKDSPTVRKNGKAEVSQLNYCLADRSVFIAISQEKNFVWRCDSRGVHYSSRRLVNLLSESKKERHAASESTGQDMKSKPMGDVNILKGKDE